MSGSHSSNNGGRLAHPSRPVGSLTRGTTGINRLRRSDRWTFHHSEIVRTLLRAEHPLAVDIGYGSSATTTLEWARWARRIRPDIEVVGLEINPERLQPPCEGVRFELGGFEMRTYRPHLVRAFNVLRQYDAEDVPAAWKIVTDRLQPDGFFVEGTCDELGRVCAWLVLTRDVATHEPAPLTLTLAWDPRLERPSLVAARLPKVLIHCNHPGEPIYEVLCAMDAAWDRAGAYSAFGPRMRWRRAVDDLRGRGYPVLNRSYYRDSVITLPWSAVEPRALRH